MASFTSLYYALVPLQVVVVDVDVKEERKQRRNGPTFLLLVEDPHHLVSSQYKAQGISDSNTELKRNEKKLGMRTSISMQCGVLLLLLALICATTADEVPTDFDALFEQNYNRSLLTDNTTPDEPKNEEDAIAKEEDIITREEGLTEEERRLGNFGSSTANNSLRNR